MQARLDFFLRLERAHSLTPPSGLEGCGVLSLRPACLELFRRIQENAEQGRTIVFQQLDEAGLLHEAAKLDELPGSCTSLLSPVACVIAVAGEHEPIPKNGQPLELCR